ncbi:MAG: zinc ribbon domain-containing protein [Chloroflexi bacterium]|nr:zinc ribbon domain-containing protein [Chloroflexota bacterium]
MPLYEYVCKDCNTRFDLLVRHDRADGVTCRSCDGGNVRRLVSGFATVGGYDDEFVPRQASGNGGGCCGGSCGCGH